VDTLSLNRLRDFAEGFSEHRWRNKTDAGVTPLPVVEYFNVFLNRSSRLGTRSIAAMMNKLVFQAAPEALSL